MDATTPDSKLPLTIGRYVDLTILGRGGMGAVYRAYDPELERPVAIKIMLHSTPDFVARFRREAQVIARLTHANVVQVFDFGVDTDGNPYFVMELVEGTPLDVVLRERGVLNSSYAADVAKQAANGLAAAHRAGIIHRDIKPSNLIIDPRGNVKLVDFGIARTSTGAQLTQAASLMGTPGYMAPEQAQGKSVDHRADIYALGLTLFEMVAGDAPFHAEDPIALVVMNMQQPLPDLRTRPLGVPEELVKLIERMGEKDPANRPQSCDEVVRLLDEIMGNTDSLSGQQGVVVTGGQVPPTNTYATADEPPRGRALAIGLGAFLAVVGVGIAVLVFTGSKHADPPLVVSVDRPAPPVDEHRIQNTANDPLARPPAAQALKDSPPPEKVGTKPLRVAVLKFQNLSKDPALDGMSLGIGETAASSMVGVAKGRMQLIERGDIESDIGEIDRGKDEHFDKSTTALAGKLNGVEIAVQGGFQRVGRTMRITARFVRVETGEIIDTLHVDGRVRKTFDMQDDVANALRGKLVALVDKERPPADKP